MNPQVVKVSILKQQRESRKDVQRLRNLYKQSPDFRAEAIKLAETMLKKEENK